MQRVKSKIEARKKSLTEGVMKGHNPDYPSVQHQIGIHKGLVEAEDFIREVLKELNSEDDDE